MARRPKSAKEKKRAGNPGKRPLPSNPEPAAADPNAPPSWLGSGWQPRRGEALEQWRAIVPEMRRLRLFTVFDVNLFGRYCLLMALWLQARAAVEQAGMIIEGDKGAQEKAKPYMQLIELSKELRAMESEFGGSPNSRRKIAAPEVAPPGPEAEKERRWGAHLDGE